MSWAILRRQPLSKRSSQRFDFWEGCRLSVMSTLLKRTKDCSTPSTPGLVQDRSVTAPDIAIAKAGYKILFADPGAMQLAAEHAP